MRKWYVPLTLMGLGSLGCFFLSERGREAARWLQENLRDPGTVKDWNESAQQELERIQGALDRVAAALDARQTEGRPA